MKPVKFTISLLLMILLQVMPSFGASGDIVWTAEEKKFIEQHPKIQLGVDPSFIPYEFVDKDGVYKGIAADTIMLISERVGIEMDIVPGLTWSEAYEKAVERQLDVLPCVSKTPEREKYFLYSDPYYSFIRVIILNDKDNTIHSFDDLRGKTAAVQENSSHHSFMKSYPDISLSLHKTVEDALTAVVEGDETAFIGNYATSMYLIKSKGLTNLKYLKMDSEVEQNLYFAVRKDWPELISIINKGLATITREEKIAIDNRWIGVENNTDLKRILGILAIVAIVIAGIFVVSFYWIVKLRKEIAERIKAEQALKVAKDEADMANHIKSRFLARMSHEIRTPLNAITGMTYLIKKTDVSNTQRNYLDKIAQGSRNMLGIINDILDFSKIEAGKIDIETIPFNLDKVLQQVISTVSFKVEEQGIEFGLQKDPMLPSNYLGDPMRIEQVLLNVVSNGVKFTEKGSVFLSVQQGTMAGGMNILEFCVTDTGIGMTAEELEVLFEPFGQADSSITRRFGGTGLGLSIVKSLVEMMNGSIRVESAAGQGTVFWIGLPLEADRETERKEKQKSGSIYFQGIRTLVLEKNETSLNLLKLYLGSFNVDATFVRTESEAMEQLQVPLNPEQKGYDLLITDYETPVSDGIDFVDRVHDDRSILMKPKVIMTVPLMRTDIFEKIDGSRIDLGITKPLIPSVLYNGIVEIFSFKVLEAHEENSLSDQSATFIIDHPAHVLIVEDNKTNQFIAKSILEQSGFKVSVTENGRQGVDFFMKQPSDLDLILMDLHMPVMNGYDATALIRSTGSRIPIIAMTADAIDGVEDECRKFGLDTYISKPFDPENLIRTLVDALKEHQKYGSGEGLKAECSAVPDDSHAILDEKDGIRRIGNSRELYSMILEEYYNENQDVLKDLKPMIMQRNYRDAIQVVHKIKSSTGNIGAKALFESASKLQEALKSEKEEDVIAMHEKFETNLKLLMVQIADLQLSYGVNK